MDEYEDIETKGAYETFVKMMGRSDEEMMRAIHARSRDNARTPVQWDDSANAGFTAGTPWFTVNPNYTRINAAAQIEEEDSIFQYYRKLIALRHERKLIVYGDFKLWMGDSEDIFAYTRTLGKESILVLNNFTDREVTYETPEWMQEGGELLIGNYEGEIPGILRPYEARVYGFVG